MFDVNRIRQDFPMIRNHPELIYFDNSATTYKPDKVIDALNNFYCHFNSNIERGDYETAIMADKAYADTRKAVARFVNCEEREVAFLANVTAALNQVSFGLSKDLKCGDTVLLTYAEHASNVLPWFRIKKEKGINIRYIPMDEQGNILLPELEEMLDDSIKIVSIAYVGNVLGTIQPIEEISKILHKKDILLVIDAAQAIGHRKIDFKALDIDFLCFSSHKMCGPDGVGVMIGKYDLIKDMEPMLLGGGMNARFDKDGNIIFKDAPERFEAGTPNIEGVVGLAQACNYLMDIGMEEIHSYEMELRAYLLEKLQEQKNLKIYNPDNETGPITFNVDEIFAQDVAGYLAANHIAVRSGNHCAKILHNLIGTDQSVRASLYFYNTKDEADRFAKVMKDISLSSAIDVFL